MSLVRSADSLFPQTRWSLVVDAKQASEENAMRALSELCQAYWFPLYTCARGAKLSPQDAEDCVQGFLARLIEKRSLQLVAEEKGRLRAFLRVSIKNFIAEQWQRNRRQKRGGGAVHLSIDQEWAEGKLEASTGEGAEADSAFDRHWAESLLKTAFERLEAYYDKGGRGALYQEIKGCLVGGGNYGSVDGIAERLGMSSATVRSAVFKLRRRFRDYVEAEVRDTCSDEEETRAEIRYLCQILAL